MGGGGVPPTGERGGDVVHVLGRDGKGNVGRLSDRESAMEVKENGRAGRVAGSRVCQRTTTCQRESALVGGVVHVVVNEWTWYSLLSI